MLASVLQEVNAVDFYSASLDLDVEGQCMASTSLCLFILGWATSEVELKEHQAMTAKCSESCLCCLFKVLAMYCEMHSERMPVLRFQQLHLRSETKLTWGAKRSQGLLSPGKNIYGMSTICVFCCPGSRELLSLITFL